MMGILHKLIQDFPCGTVLTILKKMTVTAPNDYLSMFVSLHKPGFLDDATCVQHKSTATLVFGMDWVTVLHIFSGSAPVPVI